MIHWAEIIIVGWVLGGLLVVELWALAKKHVQREWRNRG